MVNGIFGKHFRPSDDGRRTITKVSLDHQGASNFARIPLSEDSFNSLRVSPVDGR